MCVEKGKVAQTHLTTLQLLHLLAGDKPVELFLLVSLPVLLDDD